MKTNAFQDNYPEDYANCFGCGRNNSEGLQLKSYWEGDESVCRHTPNSHYSGGFPGFLYGGMIVSLMDCHGAGTASAAHAQENNIEQQRFVTASIQVDFLKPTPLGVELEVRGKVSEISGRKVSVELRLLAGNVVCAKGHGLFVQLPSDQ